MDFGKRSGFAVENIQTFEVDGARVSSTRVRNALMGAHFNEASELLGRPYYLSGRVVHGDKLGRQLGVPTANLLLKGRKSPLNGVYAVLVQGVEDKPVPAVVNIGSRPTVGGVEDRLEVHVLNYDGNLYGRRLKVLPRAKIREEIKFKGVEQLKARIARDIHEVKDFFAIKN
jgi:riboflavin kinase/FMN adenylyltransferase